MLDLAKSKELTHKVVEGVGGVTVSDAGHQRHPRGNRPPPGQGDRAGRDRRLQAWTSQMSEVLEERTLKGQLAERKKKLGLQ